jgi:hypothetical protein
MRIAKEYSEISWMNPPLPGPDFPSWMAEHSALRSIRIFRGRQFMTDQTTVEILIGTRAVWVNGNTGECLGRFGMWGIDVHRPISDQHLGECLDCTHARTKPEDWRRFQRSMLAHHGVDLSHIETPDFVKEAAK